MRVSKVFGIALLIFSAALAFPKSKHPVASTENLAIVTGNGRALFDYDQAAWQATDALMALKPDKTGGGKYVGKRTDSVWTFVFGDLSSIGDRYLVKYEAIETSAPGIFEVKKYDPPREDTGYYLKAVKALDLAFSDFGSIARPYNTAVLPSPDGNLYVYLYPAQTNRKIYPLGGDVRYTISADGLKINEKRLLHKSILELAPDPSQVAGFHSHVLTDTPEDTDVLHVLTRQPRIPEYIGTESGVYVVQTDGTISPVKK